MMRIAILTSGNPNDKKGAFNSTHQRIKHLLKLGVDLNVFIIRYYETDLIKFLRKRTSEKENKDDFFIYDNIKYINLWTSFSIYGYIQRTRLNQVGDSFLRFVESSSELFFAYDLISAHSFEPAMIANIVKKKYNIPFTVTWHGSDIHTLPLLNNAVKINTINIAKNASLNFFVSKDLQLVAKKLGIGSENSFVLYNSVDKNIFKAYPKEQIELWKKENHIDGQFNIAFIGAMVPIKNVNSLPLIFKLITQKLVGCKFYFIGNGKLKPAIEKKCKEFSLEVWFMGNKPVEAMPELINCFDAIVLPSLNEGTPLIILESLACRVPVIAARVGGIKEILGDNFTIVHGQDFEKRFSQKIIDTLNEKSKEIGEVLTDNSWENVAFLESKLYFDLNLNLNTISKSVNE